MQNFNKKSNAKEVILLVALALLRINEGAEIAIAAITENASTESIKYAALMTLIDMGKK